MHIPDGYLGPATCGVFYAVMLPIWTLASKIVKKTLKAKQVPMLAIGAAFSFVIMMFNVPIPGGSTGHAVGGVLVAVLLGPWAACIAITVALLIQALLFGDGGIMTMGANCFNMAFILPFVGYYTYRLISLAECLVDKGSYGSGRFRFQVRKNAARVHQYLLVSELTHLARCDRGRRPQELSLAHHAAVFA